MAPNLSNTWPKLLESARRVVAAGALAGFCFVVADAFGRRDWHEVALGRHFSASALLYVTWGVGVGLCLVLLDLAARRLSQFVAKPRGNAGVARGGASDAELAGWRRYVQIWLPLIVLALVVGWGAHRLLLPLVSHGKAAKLASYTWPIGLLMGAGVALGRWLVGRADRSRAPRARWLLIIALFAVAGGCIAIDLSVLVSLYASFHALLEATALLALFAGSWCLVRELERRFARARHGVLGLAVLALLGALVFPFARTQLFDDLRPAWREPVYVGRLMARVQTAEEDLLGSESADGPGVKRLKRLYDLTVTTQKASWSQPAELPEETEAALAKLRPDDTGLNILVYYVDTLRSDVAFDAKIMPNVARFCEEALCFDRAYSPASDTVSTLPVVMSGRFDATTHRAPTLLELAQASGRETTLVIPRSAKEFLERELPSFKFNRVETIADFQPGEQVWGYGATGPTAAKIVDRALASVVDADARASQGLVDRGAPGLALGLGTKPQRQPSVEALGLDPRLDQAQTTEPQRGAMDAERPAFFTWLFNFDVHNWRELDDAYVKERAEKLGVGDPEDPIFRYRVAARSVDEEFGRLLRELDRRGLKQRTLVVFMADHGEALGKHGFWVHSTFLWEGLVRVPLGIRIPGVPGKKVGTPVSLADVAPTLIRALQPARSLSAYHGEDLLVHALPEAPARRQPILMEAWYKTDRLRIGVVDAERRLKLVVPLESGVPEVHRIDDEDPEATERSSDEAAGLLAMLDHLVGSPLFPRPAPPVKPTVAAR